MATIRPRREFSWATLASRNSIMPVVPVMRILLPGSGFVLAVPRDGPPHAVRERDPRLPPERPRERHVEELAWSAVGTAQVPLDLALVSHSVGDETCNLRDRRVHARPDVNRIRADGPLA